jgi:hypothetical protein
MHVVGVVDIWVALPLECLSKISSQEKARDDTPRLSHKDARPVITLL